MGADILGPIFIFASIAVVLFKYLDARHKERMAIIEKGLNPAEYKELYRRQYMWRSHPLSSLKWGLLAVFVGLGVFSGAMVVEFANLPEPSVVALVFIWGGAGLLVYYFIAAKKMKEKEPQG